MSATLTVGKGQRTRIYIHVAKTLVKIYKTFQLKKKGKENKKTPLSRTLYLPAKPQWWWHPAQAWVWDLGQGPGLWFLEFNPWGTVPLNMKFERWRAKLPTTPLELTFRRPAQDSPIQNGKLGTHGSRAIQKCSLLQAASYLRKTYSSWECLSVALCCSSELSVLSGSWEIACVCICSLRNLRHHCKSFWGPNKGF